MANKRIFTEEHRRNLGLAHKGLGVKSIQDRLDSRTLKTDTCWVWTGGLFRNGYAQFCGGVLAHRVAWEFANKTIIPAGRCVCHSCDNRLCVNPAHLFLGTNKDNMMDCVNKGRLKSPFPVKLNHEQVVGILLLKGEKTQREIAGIYGITQAQVSNIHRGSEWGVIHAQVVSLMAVKDYGDPRIEIEVEVI